ncbi:MAG: hypothetical protein LBE13_16575, partial [Bacteroidales bacterium]|nr:hypothetical protein [Bacteroidales bacterium]
FKFIFNLIFNLIFKFITQKKLKNKNYTDRLRINFTRPEQSDCLKKLTKNDPRYQESIIIIRRGKDQLIKKSVIPKRE